MGSVPRALMCAMAAVALYAASACSADDGNAGETSTTVSASADFTATPSPSESGSPETEGSTDSGASADATSGDSTEPSSAGASEGPTAAPDLPTETASADSPIEFATGVDVEITGIEATEVEATTPGEVSGTAVLVTVAVRNQSTEPINLDSSVVTLEADDEYGIPTTAGDPTPLAGELDAGDKGTGTYVFMLDPAKDRAVTITVNYAAGEPVAIFSGESS